MVLVGLVGVWTGFLDGVDFVHNITQTEGLEDLIEGSLMHFRNPTTSRDHLHSSAKEIKEVKETKEDSYNNVDQDSAKDPLRCNTILPMHLVG